MHIERFDDINDPRNRVEIIEGDGEVCKAEMARLHDEAIQKPGIKSVQQFVKVGRNEKCPCGSGVKFKKCCLRKHGSRQVPAPA